MSRRWPERLWIVRHGQSAGNVARDAADAAGLPVIDIAGRDMDVPLSALGERQAAALGAWFAAMPAEQRPTTVLTSTYLRARQTADHIEAACGLHPDSCTEADERLREKEFGILDRLTRAGIESRFPDQAEARTRNVSKSDVVRDRLAGTDVEATAWPCAACQRSMAMAS